MYLAILAMPLLPAVALFALSYAGGNQLAEAVKQRRYRKHLAEVAAQQTPGAFLELIERPADYNPWEHGGC